MNLRQIKYFVAIADAGSFSKAAESLHIAQPSLSQHVRNLEEELGVELLNRHPRGATPTEAGLLFCKHVRSVLRDMDYAKEAVRTSTQEPMGEVSVGLSTATCRELAVPLVRTVARQFPNVVLHIVESMSGNLDEWIQSGRLDVALLYEHKPSEHVLNAEVMIEDLVLVTTPERAPPTSVVAFEDLRKLELVLPGKPHMLRQLVETSAARAGCELNVAVNCDSFAGIVELVLDGYAAIFSEFGVSREVTRGTFVCTPIVDPTPQWRLSVVQSGKSSNPRATEAVAQALQDIAQGLVVGALWKAKVVKTIGRS